MPPSLRLSPDVNVARDPTGCVLLDLRRGLYYSVNGIGAILLEAVQQRTDINATYAALSVTYDVSEDVLKGDGQKFIDQLLQLGLIINRGDI
jgi:hypothetical protein